MRSSRSRHNVTRLHVTTQQHTDLHTHIQVITRIIEAAVANQGLYMDRATKACPMKLPSFSGLISEDFLAFKAKFKRASIENRITRKDQIEKLPMASRT